MIIKRCLLVAALVLGLAPAGSLAQISEAPYQHPLFVGEVKSIPESAFDQQHLLLNVRIEHAREVVEGMAMLQLTPVREDQHELVLFAADMQIHEVALTSGWADHEGLPLTFLHTGLDSLVIDLEQPFDVGDPVFVRIAYTAMPTRGLYFIAPDPNRPERQHQVWSQGQPEENRHWFPSFDYPSNLMTSELIATVDQPFRVLSNGTLLREVQHDDGTATFHYLQDLPHASYLVALVAGEYEVLHDEITLPDDRVVPLEYWVYPEQVGNAARTFGRTSDMMRFFSERLNYPYPWDKYAQVIIEDFHFGGMENTTVTTLTDVIMVDERAALDYSPDGLIAHELAHHWFGNLVTARYWNHLWLNEGFATYFDALFTEHHEGADAFEVKMFGNARRYLAETERYRRPLVWDRWETPINMMDAHTYPKGAWVVHMLRNRLGEEVFWRGLNRYLRDNAHQPVTTSDLRRALEDESDQGFERFFDQWIFGAGHPQLDVTASYDGGDRRLQVTVRQTQEGYLVPPVFHTDLTLEVHTLDGESRFSLPLDQREQTFSLPLPMEPEFIVMDPDNVLLAEFQIAQSTVAWFKQLRQSNSVSARIRASEELAALGDDPALLIGYRGAFSNEPVPAVRAAIIRAIGEMSPTTAAERALIAAYEDQAVEVRRATLLALRSHEGSEEVAALARRAANEDRSYAVQAEAVRLLAHLHSFDAMDYVRAAMVTPSYREVIRQAAFDALAVLEIADQESLPLALEWVRPDRPILARVAAISHLQRLAPTRPAAQRALLAQIDDPSYRIRLAVITALATGGTDTAIPVLERRLEVEPDGRLIAAMDEALRLIRER